MKRNLIIISLIYLTLIVTIILLSVKGSPTTYEAEPPTVIIATEEVTCYTGVESHGADGREDGVSIASYRYPQGTWINIEGIGDRRVDTVTAEKYAHRIDVWFGMDYKKCLEFGIQQLQIKIIE